MLTIGTVLVPVDFSERSIKAAEHASLIAKRFDSQVILLHVVPWHALSAADAELRLGAPPAEQIAAARKHMSLLEARLSFRPSEVVVLWGEPAKCIERFVWERHPDLIIMPTHGYGGFRRFLLGSVTAKVLDDVSCPIFSGVHLPEIDPFRLSYKQAVCAIDLNEYAPTVLRWASDFARAWSAGLVVVHAVKCLESEAGRRELTSSERLAVNRLLADVGCDADVQVDAASVVEYVPEVTRQVNGDVLVIGRTVGEEWSGKLRTTAYSLIRESPCPVISV